MSKEYILLNKELEKYLSCLVNGQTWTTNPNEAAICFVGGEDPPTILGQEGHYLMWVCREDWADTSVSNGTNRTQDLIPVFLHELDKRSPDMMANTTRLYRHLFDGNGEFIPGKWLYDDKAWWRSSDANSLMHCLFDSLGSICPPGIRFGAHEGNGSDFGFWANEEED